MRIPVGWLNEYVPNKLSVRDLAFILTNVGLEVEAIEQAGTAAVFDIKVTPNRGDCLSVAGVARELAMKLRRPLADRRPEVVETGPPAESLVRVTLDDPVGCPRYSARVARGVRIAPSPDWAQRRLELCGMRPISNVVDATNLVMLELGQPLHAFDYGLLKRRSDRLGRSDGRSEPEIIVRRARAGERLVTIDGEERVLTPETLLITDPAGPIALAGIMGGASTEIHDGTTEVLLESANFDPGTTRRGARALGMSTEASYRFERTVDPGGTVRALDRVCELIAEFSQEPIEIATGVVDAYPRPVKEREIELRPARVNALLGLKLTGRQMAAHLGRLGLAVQHRPAPSLSPNAKSGRGKPLLVRVPTFRQDLVTEIDLVEEIARVHGYEDIAETLPGGNSGVGALPKELGFERRVRHLIRGLGLSETVTSSLESPRQHDLLGLPPGHPLRSAVSVSNWKTADRTQLRTTLLTSLLEVIALNRRHGVEDVAVFDLGRVYLPGVADELPDQPQHLAIAVTGVMARGRWALPQAVARWDFYALKGVVENVTEAMALAKARFEPDERPWLQPGRAARVSIGVAVLGWFGELAPGVREAHDLPEPVFVAEFDMDVLRRQAQAEPRFEPLSRFPAMTRDVAFLLPRDVAAEVAGQVIEKAAGSEAESVTIFDAFEGKPLPTGTRNLAYSLVFRRPDRTLTDDEVESAMDRVRVALREKLGAQIRE